MQILKKADFMVKAEASRKNVQNLYLNTPKGFITFLKPVFYRTAPNPLKMQSI